MRKQKSSAVQFFSAVALILFAGAACTCAHDLLRQDHSRPPSPKPGKIGDSDAIWYALVEYCYEMYSPNEGELPETYNHRY